MESNKQLVKDFWNESSCGEIMYLNGNDNIDAYNNQFNIRYQLEPYIIDFAQFQFSKNKKVLEIGVGLGADHQQFASAGAILSGIDITEKAIAHTKKRFEIFGFQSVLKVGDAENLPYSNENFDIVYSWGVIHHSPNTPKAIDEIYRVLKSGGIAKIMIYHKYSFVGFMLWFRYALLKFKLFTSLQEIYDKYLESPGTKAYSVKEAKILFNQFSDVNISTVLTHADLLDSDVGQRHRSLILSLAKKIYPRKLIKILFPNLGLFMMISAKK